MRGRAAATKKTTTWDHSTSSGEAGVTGSTDTQSGSGGGRLARKKSASFATAVIDSSRHHLPGQNHTHTHAPLVSEPARPQTSTSHLGVRTASSGGEGYGEADSPSPPSPVERVEVCLADELPHIQGEEEGEEETRALTGSGSWGGWI